MPCLVHNVWYLLVDPQESPMLQDNNSAAAKSGRGHVRETNCL